MSYKVVSMNILVAEEDAQWLADTLRESDDNKLGLMSLGVDVRDAEEHEVKFMNEQLDIPIDFSSLSRFYRT